MSTGAVAPVPVSQPESQSQFTRIVNVFVAPKRAFSGLNLNSRWWLAFVLLAVSAITFAMVVQYKVGFGQAFENIHKLSPRQVEQFDRMPAEQRDRAMATAATMVAVQTYGWFVLMLIGFIIVAAVLMGTFNFGFGATLSFNTCLAVVIYASLPGILHRLLAMASLLAGMSTDGFIIQNPLGSNIGFYMDPTKYHVLYSLASSVDALTIWTLVLGGIGFSVVSKLKRGTCFAIVFGWYIFLALIGAGIAAVMY